MFREENHLSVLRQELRHFYMGQKGSEEPCESPENDRGLLEDHAGVEHSSGSTRTEM